MDLVNIYGCFSDRTRLRILNLLDSGPLCVCHVQDVLSESQVKISRHLAYLRHHGLVETMRQGQWMIYRLPQKPSRELRANLACLKDCVQDDAEFRHDRARLERLRATFEVNSPLCRPRALSGLGSDPSKGGRQALTPAS